MSSSQIRVSIQWWLTAFLSLLSCATYCKIFIGDLSNYSVTDWSMSTLKAQAENIQMKFVIERSQIEELHLLRQMTSLMINLRSTDLSIACLCGSRSSFPGWRTLCLFCGQFTHEEIRAPKKENSRGKKHISRYASYAYQSKFTSLLWGWVNKGLGRVQGYLGKTFFHRSFSEC